jgi:hypothetical protein
MLKEDFTMVELYKIDCTGKLYFCDYGLISKAEDYRMRGYIVRRAVQSTQRRSIQQRGKIINVHRLPAKPNFIQRFVEDVKYDVKLVKEIGGLVKSIFKSKRQKRLESAQAYFAKRAAA